MNWTMMLVAASALLVLNTAYCSIKIKEDFVRAKPWFGFLGILGAVGAATMLAWLIFLLGLKQSNI